MKGDFSRNTFDPSKHFSRVLMQQGRVQLDADWNEQAAILLHYLRALAVDLIGPHGGPTGEHLGFAIAAADKGYFTIGPGRYYINGILCENDLLLDEDGKPLPLRYACQPGYPFPGSAELETDRTYLVYLDVWERHITYIQDEDEQGDNPSIREVALRGPDTASRTQVVWQVKIQKGVKSRPTDKKWKELVDDWQSPNRGQLKARAQRDPDKDTDPCTASPEARYRGLENQLYRVEIHKGGKAGEATFKWSRENGSVVFPIENIASDSAAQTSIIRLGHLGRDDTLSLAKGNWVEIVNDDYALQNRPEPLLQVLSVNHEETTVKLNGIPTVSAEADKHPLLRRWDHGTGDSQQDGVDFKDGVPLTEGTGDQEWLKLEHGVQIQFQKPDSGANQYRTGDYWLIPARTFTEDVEWPGPVGDPDAVPPHGVQHHYAPLWIISVDAEGKVTADPKNDCRRSFKPV